MPDSIERLTPRERECLRLVAAHMRSKQIARELGIAPATVNKHCENAARKLEAADRVQAALMLASAEGLPTESVDEPIIISGQAPPGSGEGARELNHAHTRSTDARPDLGPDGERLAVLGDDAQQTADCASPSERPAQTVEVPGARRGLPGALLHGCRLVGHKLRSIGTGHEPLQRIVLVFAVAALTALALTGFLAAERFAFLLHWARYGG